ncbi:MAG: hypothetical protein OXD44_08060 [Gammaproteobacteria bacterium]|nr:hypothetical protein [Gammaproteobacteria bacterium]
MAHDFTITQMHPALDKKGVDHRMLLDDQLFQSKITFHRNFEAQPQSDEKLIQRGLLTHQRQATGHYGIARSFCVALHAALWDNHQNRRMKSIIKS